MRKPSILSLLFLTLLSLTVSAGELVNRVRSKLSAGDLPSAAALVEDYKLKTGADNEYLDAVGWLARGAEMLKQHAAAMKYVAELRSQITDEKDATLAPLGAAIEVEGKVRAARDGRNAGVRFLEAEFAKAKDISLRSRIYRAINGLSLEGKTPPPLNTADFIGPQPSVLTAYKGNPVLLFLWAYWCGDCRSQAASLTRVWEKYKSQGLGMIAPTRYYGTVSGKSATPEAEKAEVTKVWKETYAGLADVPVIIDTDTMIRYGVSATPTFVLIDRRGNVRLYTPTRLTEAELSRWIEIVLKEKP